MATPGPSSIPVLQPADDVMTTLVEAKIDGEALSEMDILSYATPADPGGE